VTDTIDQHTPYARAVAGYDDDFRDRLTVEILRTIITTSTTDDVVVLRVHEIRNAIADVLAEILALEGTIPDRRLIDDHARRVRRMLAHHRRNPAVAKFKARARRIDVGKGGRA
jgi:hypothetical protein